MSQEIIDVGASANDGQGDPIRTAFIKTNNNFTELFGIGASQIIYNGTSNVNIPFLNGNVFISVGGVGNVMVLDPTGANIDGTLEVTSDVTGANLLNNERPIGDKHNSPKVCIIYIPINQIILTLTPVPTPFTPVAIQK